MSNKPLDEATRAALIARGLTERMQKLGQVPPQVEQKQPEQETPEQIRRRDELRKKLRDFWDC